MFADPCSCCPQWRSLAAVCNRYPKVKASQQLVWCYQKDPSAGQQAGLTYGCVILLLLRCQLSSIEAPGRVHICSRRGVTDPRLQLPAAVACQQRVT
jgi:hypothetical protein